MLAPAERDLELAALLGFKIGVLARRYRSQVLKQREIELPSVVLVKPEVVRSHANERTRRRELLSCLEPMRGP